MCVLSSIHQSVIHWKERVSWCDLVAGWKKYTAEKAHHANVRARIRVLVLR